MKCYKMFCNKEALALCSNHQCAYHHQKLCIEGNFGLTIGGKWDKRLCYLKKIMIKEV